MKSKFRIILLLLFVLNLEGAALAKGNPVLKPDGNPVVRRRHQKRRSASAQRRGTLRNARTSAKREQIINEVKRRGVLKILGTSETGGANNKSESLGDVFSSSDAVPAAAPPTKAMPPIDVNRTGAPSPAKPAPGIKPPTVQIKPPTR